LMDFLDEHVQKFDVIRFHMSEEDGAPGYSSSYVYYFADDRDQLRADVSEYILNQLKKSIKLA
jgi:hypothetical protein